jgi:hypothetical protein
MSIPERVLPLKHCTFELRLESDQHLSDNFVRRFSAGVNGWFKSMLGSQISLCAIFFATCPLLGRSGAEAGFAGGTSSCFDASPL